MLAAVVSALHVLAPMFNFIRWRGQLRRGRAPDISRARAFYVLNHVEMGIVVVMVFRGQPDGPGYRIQIR